MHLKIDRISNVFFYQFQNLLENLSSILGELVILGIITSYRNVHMYLNVFWTYSTPLVGYVHHSISYTDFVFRFSMWWLVWPLNSYSWTTEWSASSYSQKTDNIQTNPSNLDINKFKTVNTHYKSKTVCRQSSSTIPRYIAINFEYSSSSQNKISSSQIAEGRGP